MYRVETGLLVMFGRGDKCVEVMIFYNDRLMPVKLQAETEKGLK
jgi:hypothetical protein